MRLFIFNKLEQRLNRIRCDKGNFFYCHKSAGDLKDLPGAPAFNHIGLWNDNTARLTQIRPLIPPAIFIEFLPVSWSPLAHNAFHGDLMIRLHIISATLADTDSYRDDALERFFIIRALKSALLGFNACDEESGLSFSTFAHLESITDHAHDQVIEDIESWRTHCIDASGTLSSDNITTPHNVTLDMGDIFADSFSEEMV